MPYTMDDFRRDYAIEHFKDMTVLEQLGYLCTVTFEVGRDILAGLPANARRKLQESRLPLLLRPPKRRKLLAILFSEAADEFSVDQILEVLPFEKVVEFVKRKKKKLKPQM